jgi:hypothetical protein
MVVLYSSSGWQSSPSRVEELGRPPLNRTSLSVLKSHFARAWIGVYKQLFRLCKPRFVRTMDLQKGFTLSEAVNDGSGKRWCGFRRFKKIGAPLPLMQKHTAWIRTGNLSLIKRNARSDHWGKNANLTCQAVNHCDYKKSQPEKHVESQFGCSRTLVLSPAMKIWIWNSN